MAISALAIRRAIKRTSNMINAIRFTIAAFVLATLAACASQAQPDLTPPQKRGYDAKTQLETGRRG
jgi:hypothetical protein